MWYTHVIRSQLMAPRGGLRDLRAARGWSRERVAAESNVSLMTIIRMEQGRYPRVENVIAIADALGVSLDELVGRSPPRRRREVADRALPRT
jgi:transcriptional regulator with XRE-family HTH domain